MPNKIFTLFDLPGSYPLREGERFRIFRIIDAYAKLPAGMWLNEINYRAMNLKWCPGMTPDNGVMGCFAIAVNTIYLQPENPYEGNRDTAWIELLSNTLIHELRHVWQFRKNKLLYVLCSLPLLRDLTLERDAWAVSNAAQDFCDHYISDRDSYDFILKHGGDDGGD